MNKQNFLILTIITILLVNFNLNLYAQKGDITLSFFGHDAATGNSLSLEKVHIQNISQNCDTTIFGTQPVLELFFIDGIKESIFNNSFKITQNYPNPFLNNTKFKLQLAKQQNINIKLINIQGVEIAQLKTKLPQGIHVFDVEAGRAGLYNLEISNGQISKTIKIISNNSIKNYEFAIIYAGINNTSNFFKNINENNGFIFSSGDELQMTASAEGYPNNTITDSPIANTDYNYEMTPVPIAEFTTNFTVGVFPLSIQFSDLSTNNPTSWLWDFGDGQSDTSKNCSHTYLYPGEYTISLIATNEYGSNTIIKENYIVIKNVEIYCDSTSGYVPLTVSFNGVSNLPNITSWYWDFDDGETSNEQYPSHTFLTPGEYYNVTLTVTSSGLEYTAEKIIHLFNNLAEVNFTADVTDGWVPDQTVHFTGYTNIQNPTAWQWSFGDGEVSNEQNPNHTYLSTGSFTVILSVYNANGYKTETKENYINIRYCPGNVMDNEGNIYETVGIGKHCWMKENLNIGVRINNDTDQTDNNIIEKYCYDNNESKCNGYGGLYQWDEIMQYQTGNIIQGICPDGWHVSNTNDIGNLISSQGGSYPCVDKLKSETGWDNNGNGSNSSGFTALPSGYLSSSNEFISLGSNGSFWSGTPKYQNGSDIYAITLYSNPAYNGISTSYAEHYIQAFSLRCVKDITMK